MKYISPQKNNVWAPVGQFLMDLSWKENGFEHSFSNIIKNDKKKAHRELKYYEMKNTS